MGKFEQEVAEVLVNLQRRIERLEIQEISNQRLVAVIQDQKTSGTDGGSFASGADRTRDLNTTVYSNLTGFSLASNQITLPAGDYFIIASCPALDVDLHKARLQNITDTTTDILGSSAFARSGNAGSETRSFVIGTISIGSSKVFELQHRCQTTQNTNGFGAQTGFDTEVYTTVHIWKI